MWDFGNGNLTSQMNPTAVLPDSPSVVTLTVYGTNGCSATFTDTLNLINSLNEISFENGIRIYPNPASENLFIETNISDLGKVEIVNVEGKKMLSEDFKKSISIQSLAQGVYELNCYSKNGMLIAKKRFVKM